MRFVAFDAAGLGARVHTFVLFMPSVTNLLLQGFRPTGVSELLTFLPTQCQT